jgi:hypothetical protein
MRIGAGASYRSINNVDLEPLTNEDLNGFGVNIFLNFGSF